jgi:hypothetical protein
MTGLEFLMAAGRTPEEMADVLSDSCPPLSTVECDHVSCRDCWLSWLVSGKTPDPCKGKKEVL